MPQPDDLSPYYPVFYRRYRWVVRVALKLIYRWRMRSLTRAVGRVGVALDLGCGDGWMLRSLRRYGWRVIGIERTYQSAAVAGTEHQLPMLVGNLQAIRPQPCIDLLIMFHVLEHLPDPLTTLRQCAQRLKAGGVILVAVPNLRSWQARWFGKYWFHLDVPRHLYHFSPDSLVRILEVAGFDVESLRYRSWEHDPYGWPQSLLNMMGFPYNQLMKLLMGLEPQSMFSLRTFMMMSLGLVLLVPSLLLTVVSWWSHAGAIIVARARTRDGSSSPKLSEGAHEPFRMGGLHDVPDTSESVGRFQASRG